MAGILGITNLFLLITLIVTIIQYVNFILELPNKNWGSQEEMEKTSIMAISFPFILIIISSLLTISIMTYLKY